MNDPLQQWGTGNGNDRRLGHLTTQGFVTCVQRNPSTTLDLCDLFFFTGWVSCEARCWDGDGGMVGFRLGWLVLVKEDEPGGVSVTCFPPPSCTGTGSHTGTGQDIQRAGWCTPF